VEASIHQALHITYAGQYDPKCYDRNNSIQCDYLGSNYDAHVNKYFWKIHGLVDSYVGNWLAANGYTSIDVNCNERPKCYQWKGTWEGKVPKMHCLPADQMVDMESSRKKQNNNSGR